MRTIVIFSIVLFCLAAFAKGAGPFDVLLTQDLSAEQKRAVTEASEDFAAVIAFKKPIHAKSDGFVIKDGGSLVYAGHGYRLLVLHQHAFHHGVLLIYGPEIKFDAALDINVRMPISQFALYEISELSAKLEASKANQALLPTTTSVTAPAGQEPRQP